MALKTTVVLGATPKDDKLVIEGDSKLLGILLGFVDISVVMKPVLKDQEDQFKYFTGKKKAKKVEFNIGNDKFPKDAFLDLLQTSEIKK